MALGEWIHFPGARATNLEKLRQRVRFGEESHVYFPEHSHSCTDRSSAVVESENLEVGGSHEEEGCDPLKGSPSLGSGPISSHTQDTPGRWGEVELW